MQKSESIAQIATALAAAQAEIQNPPRNREVTVQTKSGGTYKFKYATLDGILDAVRPALTKNGLWFVQTMANGDGKYRLVTTLTHKSGEWMQSEQPLFVTDASNQAFGSALTYARRYALTAMLGIASDEDDDGNGADGHSIKDTKDAKAAPKPAGNAAKAAQDKGAKSPGVPEALRFAQDAVKRIAAAKSFDELAALDTEIVNHKDLPEPTRQHLLAQLDKMQKHLANAGQQEAAE